MLKPQQTQRIYAMAARLGLVNKENDLLHEMVFSRTAKSHVSELTEEEYKSIVKELSDNLRIQSQNEPPRKPFKTQKFEQSGRGMISDGQKRKVWRLMYQLADITPSEAKTGDRLCAIIKKELHIDCHPKKPFIWINFNDASKLIEILKKYIVNAKRRKDGGRAEN